MTHLTTIWWRWFWYERNQCMFKKHFHTRNYVILLDFSRRCKDYQYLRWIFKNPWLWNWCWRERWKFLHDDGKVAFARLHHYRWVLCAFISKVSPKPLRDGSKGKDEDSLRLLNLFFGMYRGVHNKAPEATLCCRSIFPSTES